METIKKTMLNLALISLTLLVACKKETNVNQMNPTSEVSNLNASTASINLSVEDNLLQFASSEDYEQTITNLAFDKGVSLAKQLTNLNFSSLANSTVSNPSAKSGDVIDCDYLKSILNADNAVIIGKYIYRINKKEEKVFVLPKSKMNEYADLVSQNLTNKNLMVYSTGDEVISIVESSSKKSTGLFCGQSGAGEDERSGHIDCKNPRNGSDCNYMDCWVKYNRYGVYFELKAKCINTSPCREMVWHKTPAGFKVKCGYTNGPQYQWNIRTNAVGISSWVWNQYFYQGIQPLNSYWLRVVFMAKDPNWIGNPDNPSVDLEIRRNM